MNRYIILDLLPLFFISDSDEQQHRGWMWFDIGHLGNQKLAHLIKNYKNPDKYLDYGLYGACQAGHRNLAQLMIKFGAKDFNYALLGACQGGHKEIVEWMIELGANSWDDGVAGASSGGHQELVELMLKLGGDPALIIKK